MVGYVKKDVSTKSKLAFEHCSHSYHSESNTLNIVLSLFFCPQTYIFHFLS